MPTLVATPRDANANSFATEVQFIARAATKMSVPTGTTVTGTTCTDLEKQALIEATGELDTLDFIGSRATATQGLSWPRVWAINPDAPWLTVAGNVEDQYYDDETIPTLLVNATIDMALGFLTSGSNTLAVVDESRGVVRKKVDVLETEWERGTSRPSGLARFPDVAKSLRRLLKNGAGTLRLDRV